MTRHIGPFRIVETTTIRVSIGELIGLLEEQRNYGRTKNGAIATMFRYDNGDYRVDFEVNT